MPSQHSKWQATRKIKSFVLAMKHIMNANCPPIFIGTCLTYSILGQSTSSICLRSLSRPTSRNRLLLRGSSRAGLRAIPSLTFTGSQDVAQLWDLQWHETYHMTAVVYCLSRRRGIVYPYQHLKLLAVLLLRQVFLGFRLRVWSLLTGAWTNGCLWSLEYL